MAKYDEQYWFDQAEVAKWREERKALGIENKNICDSLSIIDKNMKYSDSRKGLIKRQQQIGERCRILNEKIRAADLNLCHEKLTEYGIDPHDGRVIIASAAALIKRLKLEIRKYSSTWQMEDRDNVLVETMQNYASHNVRSVPTKVAFVKEQVEH